MTVCLMQSSFGQGSEKALLWLSLDNIETFLGKEGDWTVRLLNRGIPPPKKYLFALLWFNGDTGLWVARFLEQNLRVISEESNREFTTSS